MKQLLRFLKPYYFLILIIIGLLFVQTQASLALPYVMSNIVNVGIQSGGVESATPEVLDQKAMDALKFALGENADLLDTLYEIPVDPSIYQSTYPVLKESKFYRLARPASTEEEMLVVKALLKQFKVDQPIDDEEILHKLGASIVSGYYQRLGKDMQPQQSSYILSQGWRMLYIALIGVTAALVISFLSARVAASLGAKLRASMYQKVTQFSNKELDEFSVATLITRTSNDISVVQNMVVVMLRLAFMAPLLGIGGVIRAVDKSPSLSWLIGLAVLLIIVVIFFIFKYVSPVFLRMQKIIDRLNQVLRENLSGLLVMRAYNTSDFERKRFQVVNQDIFDNINVISHAFVLINPLANFFVNILMIIIVYIGAHEINNGHLFVGDLMAFIQYALQILMAFMLMSALFIAFPRALVSTRRIAEVLDTPLSVKDKTGTVVHPITSGNIMYDHVSFQYDGAEEAMLKELSFSCHAGETTAIIGSTGSGKTTLIHTLMRYYDVTSGDIFLDGQSITDYSQHELRKAIGLVTQKASLFSGTIRSNLLIGKENATDQEMLNALAQAQATELLEEEGLDRKISQSGNNLSGGQKQRLSIARALIRQPKILLFDDSFSALDYKTDLKLRKTLQMMKSVNIIIVAQRIATVKNADRIIVLDHGRIVGNGSHTELMESCQTYRDIAYSQLSEEELA